MDISIDIHIYGHLCNTEARCINKTHNVIKAYTPKLIQWYNNDALDQLSQVVDDVSTW